MEENARPREIDADILQSKADILRARSLSRGPVSVSPKDEPAPKITEPAATPTLADTASGEDKPETGVGDFEREIEREICKVAAARRAQEVEPPPAPPASPAEQDEGDDEVRDDNGIPQFNLADQILAEQRRVAAQRRLRTGEPHLAHGQAARPAPEPAAVSAANSRVPSSAAACVCPASPAAESALLKKIVAADIARLCASK